MTYSDGSYYVGYLYNSNEVVIQNIQILLSLYRITCIIDFTLSTLNTFCRIIKQENYVIYPNLFIFPLFGVLLGIYLIPNDSVGMTGPIVSFYIPLIVCYGITNYGFYTGNWETSNYLS